MPRLVHFEIHASEPEKLKIFYEAMFGWEIKPWPGMQDYFVVITGPAEQPGINGGLLKRRGRAPKKGDPITACVCTMEVENLDAMVEKATKMGGRLALPKQVIPGMAWLAYCADLDGNIFGMIENDTNAK